MTIRTEHGAVYRVTERARGVFDVRVLTPSGRPKQRIPCTSGRVTNHYVGSGFLPPSGIVVHALHLKVGANFRFRDNPWEQVLDPCCGITNTITAIEP